LIRALSGVGAEKSVRTALRRRRREGPDAFGDSPLNDPSKDFKGDFRNRQAKIRI
jgi:hypothetical protein